MEPWQHGSLHVSLLSLTAAILIGVGVVIHRLLGIDYDPREPPLIKSRIPYVGHILGMFRYGAKYFDVVNRQYSHPIYTLPTPNVRQYIVASPQLAAQLQRSHKDLSFYNAILEVTRRMIGLNPSTMKILAHNVDGHGGSDGLMPAMHDMLQSVLGRGETLQQLTKSQMSIFSDALSSIAVDGTAMETDLLYWLQNVFAQCNIDTLYGPENPFALDKSLIRSFWDFEVGMLGLIVDVLPAITARKAYMGRERVVRGLIEYIQRGSYKKASVVIQNRVRLNLGHGLSEEESGRAETILFFAILGNAVPSTFWIIANIFSRPELLAELRQELENCTFVLEDGSRTIRVSSIKSACPLFVSTYRETLRLIGNLASIRYVIRDTVVGKQYLKGNSLVQMPGCVIHRDPRTWGEDSSEFKPRRFMKSASTAGNTEDLTEADAKESTATQLPPGVPGAAYRLFGGGSVICPGRHFAQSEILGFVAYLIMAFDMTGPNGRTLVLPEKNEDAIPLSVLKPKQDVRVRIARRNGLEKARWTISA
ncbi:uncharacterized protein HMPREF1541_02910 [Cyphellophora europaea CBS 101466]|uniref:Cytochrome P450 n=1 Tax=Cyphellophora europaea (strain CBS 101466) TaxID=1220924 RepID=W2S4Y1_CYPE1|nr:uncharacterized protein HMPREF1541_02910 [Cyphellophora europaea CBS 101466]ETN43751.1 hypothetical protein HMPREF1541_02910 [Cyphellophora europaea CBS 101466]